MQVLSLLLVTVLSSLAFAPSAAAQTPTDVAGRFETAIEAEQTATLASLQSIHRSGVDLLLEMSARGARKSQILAEGRAIATQLLAAAERGTDTMNDLRREGVTALQRMGAPARLVLAFEESTAARVARVGDQASSFADSILELASRL